MSWRAMCVRVHVPCNLQTSYDAQRVGTEGELL
jgi:hypothetical protein